MKNTYTIGEIAKLFHVGTDSLRYYEKLGILTPQRGENGYRLYGADDIWRLNIIRDLRELDMPVDAIGDYIQNRDLASTVRLLTDEIRLAEEKQRRLRLLRENLSERLQIVLQAGQLPADSIMEKTLAGRRYWAIPEGYRSDDEMNLLMQRLVRRGADGRLIGNNCIGSFFELAETPEPASRYTCAFLISKNGPREIPGGRYLSLVYRGGYHQSPLWAEKMTVFAEARGLAVVPPFLELLWADIHETAREEEFVTELQILVRDKRDLPDQTGLPPA